MKKIFLIISIVFLTVCMFSSCKRMPYHGGNYDSAKNSVETSDDNPVPINDRDPDVKREEVDGIVFALNKGGKNYSIYELKYKNLKRLEIPSAYNGLPVTSIYDFAFSRCTRLETVTIPDTVLNIGKNAFYGCNALSVVNVPASVMFIGENAFTYSPLTAINVDENNDYYSSKDGNLYDKKQTTLIQYARGKTDAAFTVPEGVKEIGVSAFARCDILTNVKLPESLERIGENAFEDCSGLLETSLPKNVLSVGKNAFTNCGTLTDVTFSPRLTSFGEGAFNFCTSLTNVYYNGSINDWCAITFGNEFSNPVFYGKKLYILNNGKYELVEDITVSKPVEEVKDFAFVDLDCLKSVTIGSSVERIGRSAFSLCNDLSGLTFSEGLKIIDDRAFAYCESLNIVNFPYSLITIGKEAFYGCTNFNKYGMIVLLNVTSIGAGAFQECTELSIAMLGNSLTTIEERAFALCKNLVLVDFYASVTDIGSRAFYGCEKLADIYYHGSEEDWQSVTIANGNDSLSAAKISFSGVS